MTALPLPSRADLIDLVASSREVVDALPWTADPTASTDQHAALLRDMCENLGADVNEPDFAAGFIAGLCVARTQGDVASSSWEAMIADVFHVVAAAQQWPEVVTT